MGLEAVTFDVDGSVFSCGQWIVLSPAETLAAPKEQHSYLRLMTDSRTMSGFTPCLDKHLFFFFFLVL